MPSRFATCKRLMVLCVLVLLLPVGSRAQQTFHVHLDTGLLVGNANGPFALDFQLTDGSGTNDANNTIALSNFTFGAGGGATGAPTLTGGAIGDLNTMVTLTDSQFFNDLSQTFLPGAALDFDVNMTGNLDSGATPDQFVLGLLDNTLSNLPTADPGGAFLLVDINASTPAVQTSAADAPYAALGAPVITFPQPVPEPGTATLLIGTAVLGTGVLVRRRRSRC